MLQSIELHQDKENHEVPRILQLQYSFPVSTHDLNMSIPTCNGSNIQQMMSSLSKMDEVTCPAACIEENIETSISFTIQSDKLFEKTLKTWNLPAGLTKEDSVTMDLYFTSLMTDVGIQEHEDKI